MADDTQWALSPQERAQLIQAIYQSERVRTPGKDYLFDIRSQVFQPAYSEWNKAMLSKPQELDEITFFNDKAPNYTYWSTVYDDNPPVETTDAQGNRILSLPANATLETVVIGAIKSGYTPTELTKLVSDLVANPDQAALLKLDATQPYQYQNIARTLYNEHDQAKIAWENAKNDYANKNAAWNAAYGDMPNPEDRYKPTDFQSYVEYETGVKEQIKKRAGKAWTPQLETGLITRLRDASQKGLDQTGITPFTDWAIKTKAFK